MVYFTMFKDCQIVSYLNDLIAKLFLYLSAFLVHPEYFDEPCPSFVQVMNIEAK